MNFTVKSPLRRENKGFLYISSDYVFGFPKRLTKIGAMGINLLREAALPDVVATLKEPRFFARIRWYLRLSERNQPRGAACRYRTDSLTITFAGLHFCVHRAGWRDRSGKTTGKTFAGWSGLVSGVSATGRMLTATISPIRQRS